MVNPGSVAASVKSITSVFGSSRRSSVLESSLTSTNNESLAHSSDSSTNLGDDSDSDQEDVFIYSRVQNLPTTFFHKDLVSYVSITPEVEVYGTHSGIVHIRPMVSLGHDTTSENKSIRESLPRTVRVHRASVLDIDCNSAYVATASIDGTVVIASILEGQETLQASYKRPIHAIALHPDYSIQKSYVCGGTAGQIVLSEKGWLKSRNDTVLVQTGSTILALNWIKSRIIWCNEDGITIYNVDDRIIVNRISQSRSGQQRADLYRPRINRYGPNEVVISWAQSVYIVEINNGTLRREYKLSGPVAGAVKYNTTQLAVLVKLRHAELQLIDLESGNEVYNDEIELINSENLNTNDFHLQFCNILYVVSARDAVTARERTINDHIHWLIDHDRLLEAYEASGNPQAQYSSAWRRELGLRACQKLQDEGNWNSLAAVLPTILDSSSEDGESSKQTEKHSDWLLWANKFLSSNQFLVFGDIIPRNMKLSNVHDTILLNAIETNDHNRIEAFINEWSPSVYDQRLVASRLELKATNVAMKSCLATLYLHMGDYIKAVKVFKELNSSQAYSLVLRYHLWNEKYVLDNLGPIISSGSDSSGNYVGRLQGLIEIRNELSPSKVVQVLRTQENDLLLFGYLTELGEVDESYLSEFANLMIELYAKYDTRKLMAFLQKSESYDIDRTIKLCRNQHLYSELVFLLGKIGLYRDAIDLIILNLRDFERAVNFALTQGPDTFDYLITYCKSNPELVLELMKCVEISPTKILAAIPSNMTIPGLKFALCNIIKEQEINISLSAGALAVIKSESYSSNYKLRSLRSSGTVIDPSDEYSTVDWSKSQLFTRYKSRCIGDNYQFNSLKRKNAHLRSLMQM